MQESDFYAAIQRFNEIYRLPVPERPQVLGPDRVRAFMDILTEEVAEGTEIAEAFEAGGGDSLTAEQRLEVLTGMADWLGDIIVYCASEARRWGIPIGGVLAVIMESNFSKLGEDGQPIYDHRGKVMKGPGYWRPEARIRELLAARLQPDGGPEA